MPLSDLKFDNRLLDQLPGDQITDNYCRHVERAAYSFVQPTPTSTPSLVAISQDLANSIGFSSEDIKSQQFLNVMTGNQLLAGMQPYALCYGGHQFGQWAGQLGDGRAINLGEIITPKGNRQTLQLKGAGKTPYSRHADGLAVLRSSVREFLCSEAMYYLGVPTSRALSLCLTGKQVLRDKMYDGNSALELGAIVCRVSPSFLRFGSFQLPTSRSDTSLLKQLVEFSINNDFKHLRPQNGLFTTKDYLNWFSEICDRTNNLMVHWMRVGFVHGVMNTDNMSIIGETIDYGPYGWIDNFDLTWTPNTSDHYESRYAFGNQPGIGQWNLMQLANAIFPLIDTPEQLQTLINDYTHQYQQKWTAMMACKLGFEAHQGDADLALYQSLEKLLSSVETDMTIFYRNLANLPKNTDLETNNQWFKIFESCYYQLQALTDQDKSNLKIWLTNYLKRIQSDHTTDSQRATAMNQVNPKFVLRNYLAQQAIELAEQGDYSEIKKLQKILQSPYQAQPQYEKYADKRPEWARDKIGCSALSCSS